MKHILIDFENIQPSPDQLSALSHEDCHIWLFLGKLQQKTISLELCEALCQFGKNIHFIRVARTGKNALDFYLSYYLGKITEQDKDALICIFSKDGGFEVLVEHLEQNHLCQGIIRLDDLSKLDVQLQIAIEENDKDNIIINNVIEEVHSDIPQYQNSRFIGMCLHKVGQSLCKNEKWHYPIYNDLISEIKNNILNEELYEFNDDIKNELVNNIINKLLEKGFIEQESDGILSYHFISHQALLDILINHVVLSRAKTLTALKNVVRTKASSVFYDLQDDEIDTLVLYLERNEILKILNNKIKYPPFTELQADLRLKQSQNQQLIIINPEEDIKIMQTVGKFFNKHAKNKPSTKKALLNAFKSFLKLQDKQVETLIQILIAQSKLTVGETGKIVYKKLSF
ncbi:PIN domain-containing protein [Neisseria montereyensis]|uniref:PIN domain-containing protein n=1 Tax=Neisseria montereyensis TaxID=2973938 RepID=A0ABT2FAM4_9NEIS|nr:PIN domain-containing protein [Neisseria montereyensis]MCS4533212.1 PIN domain-containing protein [Neisseria montereyensis]